jgi:hypothetical protein
VPACSVYNYYYIGTRSGLLQCTILPYITVCKILVWNKKGLLRRIRQLRLIMH